MSTKNKVLFALLSISCLLLAVSVIGVTRLGLNATVGTAMFYVAVALFDIVLLIWLGIRRVLRYLYIAFVFGVVIGCVAVIALTDSIITWIVSIVFAILAVASLIPIVFKSK